MPRALLLTLALAACATAPLDWTTKYAPDQKYLNRSNIAATVFGAPNSTSTPKGSINPGQGGFIQTCNEDASWCKISYGGLGATGWVNMTAFFPADF
jgi:hypothetical protein